MITITDVNAAHRSEPKTKGFTLQPTPADLWVYALTFGPGILLLAAIWFQTHVPIPVLMKDPLAVVPLVKTCCHCYYCLVSNLGVVIWTAGAAVCLFTSVLLFSVTRNRTHWVFFCGRSSFHRLADI